MILSLKITSLIPLLLIAIQDFKERKVFWFLFPILGLLLGMSHATASLVNEIFIYNIVLNCLLVTAIICVLYLVTKYLFKKSFLKQSFGLGDLLFFYAFALGFPTMTFIVLFANSLVFSLIVYIILKKSKGFVTVPLAGLMSLFMICIFFVSFFIKNPSLYQY